MALIFPRLARNFIKNGYYPTDEVTLQRIINYLDAEEGEDLRILDPCCGEGTALADIKHHLISQGANTQAYGIELDEERAWHAKGILDSVIHSDTYNVTASNRSFGFLFLNPPYGDQISDKANLGDDKKTNRLEKLFYRKTVDYLQFGGVMVLIVPFYVLDSEFSAMIARNFETVRVFLSPVKTYKQAVIFGIKCRSKHPDPRIQSYIESFGTGERTDELPESLTSEDLFSTPKYKIPSSNDDLFFKAIKIDGKQLQSEIDRLTGNTLWSQFNQLFTQTNLAKRNPLREMSTWHTALALAAGLVTGLVTSISGRKILLKGYTYKTKDVAVDESDNESTTTVSTDRFVPKIIGIDFTDGPNYGNIVSIE